MPQITASTARRSAVRRTRSPADSCCAFAHTAAQTRPNAAEMIFFIAPLRRLELEAYASYASGQCPLWLKKADISALHERPRNGTAAARLSQAADARPPPRRGV